MSEEPATRNEALRLHALTIASKKHRGWLLEALDKLESAATTNRIATQAVWELEGKLKAAKELATDWKESYRVEDEGIDVFLSGVAAGAGKCADELQTLLKEQL